MSRFAWLNFVYRIWKYFKLKLFAMKNHFVLFIIAMHCFLSLNAKSQPNLVDLPSFVESDGKGIVTLHLMDWHSDSVKVSFFQDGQAAIFEETHLTERNARLIDFANLPSGIYVFEVEDALKLVQQKVLKTPDDLVIFPQVSFLYKPTFKKRQNHWLVGLLTQGHGCSINILDAQENIIYLEAVQQGQTYLSKSFNHVLLQPGLYTVKIVVQNRVFSREFFKEPNQVVVKM